MNAPVKACTTLLVAAAVLLTGCDSGDDLENIGARSLRLTLEATPPQPDGYHYEGWINVEGEDRSFGKFNVDDYGRPTDINGLILAAGLFETDYDLDSSLYAFVTIEPPGDVDDQPSDTRLMGGLVRDYQARLLVTNYEGLEDALILSRGTYVLATPTNGPDSDETSGIWFINLTGGGVGRGLQVPIPLSGWRYEGWVVGEGFALSTGTITHHSRDDDAAPYSGTGPSPGFPGEDFLFNAPPGLTFPLRLQGATVIVTLEPDPDPDPDNRSTLELLRGQIPGEAEADSTYLMDLPVDRSQYLFGFPAATVLIDTTVPAPQSPGS